MSQQVMSTPAVTHHRFSTEPVVLRNPERGTPTDRTRRAIILLLLTLLIPGAAQIAAGHKGFGRKALAVTVSAWALLLVGVIMFFTMRQLLFNLATNGFVMWLATVLLAGLAIGWAILWLDTFRLIRWASLAPGMKPIIAVATVLLMVLTSGVLGYAANMANTARSALGGIFGGGPSIPAVDGRYNFLLLGSDAGEGREGVRPDSIHVVSVNEDTGESLIISVPRNFQNAQFSEDSPMRQVYPEGYNCGDECIINALYTEVMNEHTGLYPEADNPGAEAMMDAVSGTLDLEVQGYVMVDMDGFSELIDAMGGVDVESGGWVPYRGVRPDGEWGDAWWEPGEYTFSGDEALAYARSRAYSSDYNRIQRQQCIQSAMISQFSPQTVLTQFSDIMRAGEQMVETNLPQSQLGSFLDLATKVQSHQPQRLVLGAPDFGTASERFSTFPDFDQIHDRVDDLIANETDSANEDGEEDSDGGSNGQPAEADGAAEEAAPATPEAPAEDEAQQPENQPEGAEENTPEDAGAEPPAAVEEDEPPIEETPPPSQPDGSPLTEEYLMEAQDSGQISVLEEAASTNHRCTPL